ncbi:MAG: hypothetical protein ACN6RD_04415 [Stenotrophomonas maltophilia]
MSTLNCAPTGALSLLASEPLSACPAGVDSASSTADGATTIRTAARAQLPGAAASHSW